MKVILRGEKDRVTEAMTSYATEKLSKLDKYLEKPEEVQATVLVKNRGHQEKVEVTIPVKSFILRAEESQADYYAAIDEVLDVLERQIKKMKAKLQKHSAYKKKEVVFDYSSYEEDEEENDERTIIKRKTIDVKPMSEEEAVLQMELLGHEFYLFKDADTNKPSVVYKRKDGNYGIIESE